MKPQEIMYNWCDFLIKIIKNYKTKISYSSLIMDNMIRRVRCESNSPVFNPIPAGVLKNQDMLGGSIWPPPPLNPMFYVQIWQIIIIRKLLCSTFRICKKICKFSKIEFFIAKCVKMFAKKKNLSKKMTNYTFLKSPWPCHFKYAKFFAKF